MKRYVLSASNTRYFANMVSCATDDPEYKYYVAGYYDNLMRRMANNLSTDSFDAVLNFADELAKDGLFIELKNMTTGTSLHYDANVWLDHIEQQDIPEEVFELT